MTGKWSEAILVELIFNAYILINLDSGIIQILSRASIGCLDGNDGFRGDSPRRLFILLLVLSKWHHIFRSPLTIVISEFICSIWDNKQDAWAYRSFLFKPKWVVMKDTLSLFILKSTCNIPLGSKPV